MAEKRFRALRAVATLVKLLAVLVLIGGIVGGSLLLGMGAVGPLRDAFSGVADDRVAGMTAAVAGVGMILMSVFYFVILYGAAEGIYLLLAVEQHSRDSADLMREMWNMYGQPKRQGIQPLTPDI